jgi:hypothetical protein
LNVWSAYRCGRRAWDYGIVFQASRTNT